MMKVLVVPAVLAAFCVGAADFTLKTSVSEQSFDWSDASNYVEETAPAAGATLESIGGNLKTASFTPVNCTGVENLSNWTLLVDGEEDTKYTVKVSSDGMVRLISPAMRVIVR